MRFLQASDFHLRPDRPERLAALARVARLAAAERADALLVPGDLFDDPGSATALRSRVREILEGFAGTTLLVPGNHDLGPGGATAFPDGADWGRRTVVLAGGPWTEHRLGRACGEVRVVGVPFRRGSTLGRDLAGLGADPTTSVLLAHGTLQHDWLAAIEDAERAYYPIRRADLEGRFAYAALGHLHGGVTFEGWSATAAWGYAGSPVAITRGETGPRHAVRVDFEPGRGVRDVRALRLATPYWEVIEDDVSPWEGRSEPLARLGESLRALSDPADADRGVLVRIGGWIDGDEAGFRRDVERELEAVRASNRLVELERCPTTVGNLLDASPWLSDLLARVRRLAAEQRCEPAVARRAVDHLVDAVSRSGA